MPRCVAGASAHLGGWTLLTRLLGAALLATATPSLAAYQYTTINAPAANVLGTIVTGINDGGLATGYYVTADPSAPVGAFGAYTAFTVNADGSGFTSFTRPGYAQTGAAGINNAGDITGVAITAGGGGVGFVRSGSDGSYVDIDPNAGGIAALYSEAIGINNLGAVTGFYVNDPAATVASLEFYAHGFVTLGGVYTAVDIDPLLGFGTRVISINDIGVITGTYLDNTADHFRHGFIGTLGNLVPLPADPFGAPSAEIGNVTLAGLATYNSLYPTPLSPLGYVSAAYVVDIMGGGVTPIAAPGALFTEGFGINLSGQVTGLYVDGTGLHGFIASNVPEPATWALLLTGFGLLGGGLRRRRTALAQG